MNETQEKQQMSNLRKAAIFMLSIGAKASSLIYKHLNDDEIENVTAEITRLENVGSQELTSVSEEFHQMILAQQYIMSGGLNYAREILEGALGPLKALEITRRVQSTLQLTGFSKLENVETSQLLAFLQKEHPQTIAVVLSHASPAQAAAVIGELPPPVQTDVVHRIASMASVSPDTLAAVETVLETNIEVSESKTKFGGLKPAAEILNLVGRRVEKNILSGINKKDSDMAFEIKNLMFVFEDIVNLDDRSVQKVLKEVDTRELAMALKACTEETKQKILNNMSKRAADLILEELEYMGPVRLREVEEVQQKLVDTVRRLEEEGEIVISTTAEEDQLV